MKHLGVFLLLLAALMAGCLTDGEGQDGGTTTDPPARTMPEDPMPEGDGHDHGDPAQHQFLWGYDFAARDPILSNPASAAGLHALDVQGDLLFGAVYGSHSAGVDGGLVIWDISDPAAPSQLGRYPVQGAVGGDRSMEATDDGAFAVLATEPLTCFGQIGSNLFDVHLIDTRDPTQPRFVDGVSVFGPSAGSPTSVGPQLGVHSVVVHRFDDQDYAFLMGQVYRIERDGPTGATLVDTGVSLNVGHDLYVRDTPWGTTWALSANGGRNFQVYDVTDPLAPVEIANWQGDDVRYLHTADVGFEDGQATIVLSSEDWEDHPSHMWVFNATQLKDHDGGEPYVLEPAFTWMNPGEHTAAGLSFSLHNPRFGEDNILTISSYHGGLWQLDLRGDHRLAPKEIAYAVYAEGEPPVVEDPVYDAVESNVCGLGIGLDTPTYMDVELGPDGILYAADVYMGLYTFTPTADHPVYGSG